MKYRVHHFRIRMIQDQSNLEQFLNNLDREAVMPRSQRSALKVLAITATF